MKKILLYSILALLVIILAAFIFLGRYTDHVVDPYVRTLLETTKPMGHEIKYDKIRVNLFQKLIVLKEVRMQPGDSLTENDLQIRMGVKDISLTGFSIRKLLFDKTLIIQDILIEKPEVTITLPMKPEEAIKEIPEESATIKKPGKQLLTNILLKRIILSDGSFRLIHNDSILANSPAINVIAEDISLEKNSREEPIGFTYGDYLITLTEIELHGESSLYRITLDKFSAGKKNLTIALSGLKITPKYDKKEFSKYLKFQTDRFDLKIKEMTIRHTGLWKLLEKKPLEITMLRIDSVDADIYRDKNVAFNFERFPPFYNESFMKIPLPLYIDTVAITNSKILYGELVAEHPVAGTILLEDFNLQSYGLTNQVADDTIDNVMKFNIQAKVMGEGNLSVELILPLEGNMHDFECSGSIGAMKLLPLNDMLQPSINMKFIDGKVDRMTFHFAANDNVSNGWMEFLYHDVKVELLKKDPDKQWGFVSSLATAVAMTENPPKGKEMKIVEIGYERDKNKGIINYVWRTIQSGMVRTIVPTKKYQINKEEAAAKNKLYRKASRTEKKLDKQDQNTEKAKAKELEKTTEPDKKKK